MNYKTQHSYVEFLCVVVVSMVGIISEKITRRLGIIIDAQGGGGCKGGFFDHHSNFETPHFIQLIFKT